MFSWDDISIGNHMISSAIWNKKAQVNFSKTNKSARARRASALCGLWKIYKCLFNPNCTRKIMWLLINNIHEKHNYNNKVSQFQFIQLFGSNRLQPLSNSSIFKTNVFKIIQLRTWKCARIFFIWSPAC